MAGICECGDLRETVRLKYETINETFRINTDKNETDLWLQYGLACVRGCLMKQTVPVVSPKQERILKCGVVNFYEIIHLKRVSGVKKRMQGFVEKPCIEREEREVFIPG